MLQTMSNAILRRWQKIENRLPRESFPTLESCEIQYLEDKDFWVCGSSLIHWTSRLGFATLILRSVRTSILKDHIHYSSERPFRGKMGPLETKALTSIQNWMNGGDNIEEALLDAIAYLEWRYPKGDLNVSL